MSDLREPLHQPPNPDDLRRVPPANPTCARIRGLLRDYVDGDLGRDLCEEVEEHAHCCRVCAVELSRAEHERLTVCRGFAVMAQGEPPLTPGFSDRVLQRLLNETSAEGRDVASDVTRDLPSDLQTGAARLAADQGRSPGPRVLSPRIRAWLEAGHHTLLAAGLLVLVCAGIVFSWSIVADREPGHSARLVVTAADGAFGAKRRPLKSGDGLGDLQSLWVDAGGAAVVEWHDFSALRQPAATLDVRGGGVLRLENGAPLLVNGKIGVVTNRPVEIPMSDGSSLRLGVGEYSIAAEVPSDWLNGPNQAPMNPFDEPLQVEVEVLSGDPAEINRLVGSRLVAAGTIGVYQGNSTVTFRPGGGGLASNQGNTPDRRSPVESSASQTNFGGRVIDRFGLPNRGASVNLSWQSGGMQRTLTLVSDEDGSFSETTDTACDRLFAIVQVEPAAVRLDLGITPPQAMPVVRLQSNVQLANPIVLNLSAPLVGSVRDDYDIPRSHVRVLPCIVDELFGTVLPLMSGQAVTDVSGAFQIKRLPSRLPPHQHLVVILLDSQLEPTVVPVPERDSEQLGNEWWAPLSMVARRLRPVQLYDMWPANTLVEVLEEVPGLPGESAVVRRTATTNSSGRVNNFMKGSGRLWWRRGTAAIPTVKELVRDTQVSFPRYRPGGAATQPRANVFRPMANIAGTELHIVQSWRHQQLGAATNPGSGTGNDQALFVVDGLGHNVSGAQVFSMEASGPRGSVDTCFHGFTSASGVFPLTGIASGTQLLVLGPEGEMGQITVGSGQGSLIPLTLVSTGSVLLGQNLRPTGSEAGGILPLHFEFLGPTTAGMRPVAVRFACAATGWVVTGLPPGPYRMTIDETAHLCEVPAGGFVEVH